MSFYVLFFCQYWACWCYMVYCLIIIIIIIIIIILVNVGKQVCIVSALRRDKYSMLHTLLGFPATPHTFPLFIIQRALSNVMLILCSSSCHVGILTESRHNSVLEFARLEEATWRLIIPRYRVQTKCEGSWLLPAVDLHMASVNGVSAPSPGF